MKINVIFIISYLLLVRSTEGTIVYYVTILSENFSKFIQIYRGLNITFFVINCWVSLLAFQYSLLCE